MGRYTILLYCLCVFFVKDITSHLGPEETTSPDTRQEHSLNIQSRNETKNKLTLKVYYETLCGASVDYFIKQLAPAAEELSSRVDIVLVPYGHAETKTVRGHYSFECQHGPAECRGNKIHACAIDVIQNNTQAVIFNSCLMQYTAHVHKHGIDFTSALTWCGYKYKVIIKDIWKCVRSSRGSTLLKIYGEETDRASPQYVPYTALDGDTEELTGGLMPSICKLLDDPPASCRIYI